MKTNTKKSNKGLTLIELTVVIVVLLGLVSVLFISARAWIEGSNAAKCVVNLSSIQKAAVSFYNLNNETNPADLAALQAANMVGANISCPSGGDYTLTPTANQDEVWVACDYVATDARHVLNIGTP